MGTVYNLSQYKKCPMCGEIWPMKDIVFGNLRCLRCRTLICI